MIDTFKIWTRLYQDQNLILLMCLGEVIFSPRLQNVSDRTGCSKYQSSGTVKLNVGQVISIRHRKAHHCYLYGAMPAAESSIAAIAISI